MLTKKNMKNKNLPLKTDHQIDNEENTNKIRKKTKKKAFNNKNKNYQQKITTPKNDNQIITTRQEMTIKKYGCNFLVVNFWLHISGGVII